MAESINVDTGNYAGTWEILGSVPETIGSQLISLAPGTHTLRIGNQNEFEIVVAAGGSVTSANPDAATGGAGTLTFNTAVIDIIPGAYQGSWRIDNVRATAPGADTLDLVRASSFVLAVSNISAFLITIAADGTVTTSNPDAATGGPGTVTFNNTSISFDPSAYLGDWSIDSVRGKAPGFDTAVLVKSSAYNVIIGFDRGFVINVAADGSVTTSIPEAASVISNVVTFNTTTVFVEPNGFTGNWIMNNVTPFTSGPASVVVVPGIERYLFQVQTIPANIFFAVAAPCAVDPSEFVVGGAGGPTFNITCEDQLSCVGFEPPMADGPVTVKGKNKALPLKAVLLDGGVPVTGGDITAPPALQVLFSSAAGDPPVDVTDDALPAGQGTEGNEFVFTEEGKWQFNLKTQNYTASGEYTITMNSGDDAEYTIDPTCTAVFVR